VSASRTKHNCDLQLFCDWIEGSLLFQERRLSRTDIVDILTEEDIYDDQAFASMWLDDVWIELARRERLLGQASPIAVAPRVVTRVNTWRQAPAYAFCVLVPLLQRSRSWRPRRGVNYAQQGVLFERISEESLKGAGWSTFRTGWSSANVARLPAVVTQVAQAIGEPEHANWRTNVAPHANEAGLDVVVYRAFADGRCGFPIYLAQCATGDDWDTKLYTPSLSVWTRLVDFAAPPQKVFALPHSLGAEELRRVAVKVSGIVLDRYRLLDASRSSAWCSRGLTNDLITYLRPLVTRLPSYS